MQPTTLSHHKISTTPPPTNMSCDDFLALRNEIFSSLIFYLDESLP